MLFCRKGLAMYVWQPTDLFLTLCWPSEISLAKLDRSAFTHSWTEENECSLFKSPWNVHTMQTLKKKSYSIGDNFCREVRRRYIFLLPALSFNCIEIWKCNFGRCHSLLFLPDCVVTVVTTLGTCWSNSPIRRCRQMSRTSSRCWAPTSQTSMTWNTSWNPVGL